MKCYVVDAFADKLFQGNPAAVCLPERWCPDGLMQEIAGENNLSETAFAVKSNGRYELRWFTPGGEIDLCGHATLAAAYVIMRFVEPGRTEIVFWTKSGPLTVKKRQDLYEMDLPAYQLTPVPVTDEMERAIGIRPLEAYLGRDLVCVLEHEDQVRRAAPEEARLRQLDGLLLQLTAPGRDWDCVTRSFAPKLNVWEDPVCGSGHCHVIPLWAKKLERTQLHAFQASRRTGVLHCRLEGDRVFMAGSAALYSAAELCVPQEEGELCAPPEQAQLSGPPEQA